ncbi:hypothetical protein AGABI1DRAFT_132568 [Agaricus bisporus var. burnettii JB137-S8]|uniref:Oxidation resistance protein 1 n=1 Tax=Agaricus bisporus var. burnettii (strain JB137-S8 / ATCC MYA-4627 / FGSC 10392) TaxID=597362 RepID=K5VL76_AGABU|nr:uncharacterized protein AGABI1DRAFT_132568 [Agaricus bisporus var. burnettii JB137-S8]EKM75119.1 hypothetical protein AGABI1DRAFT_132568 [Agaricus bisporus var. burnettii JB137-S8]
MNSDDDFGPFVGPLDAPPSPKAVSSRTQFLEEAKASTDRNRRAILDELLAHEDDPLYFHHCHPAPPIASTPTVHPEQSPPAKDSWFSSLHDRVPSPPKTLPFARSFFSLRHANTAPPAASSPSLKPDVSPFAQHVFVPIPGAPGFKPEEYDWDKGFSAELEHEAQIADNTNEPLDPTIFRSQSPAELESIKRNTTLPPSIGDYIEKKSGKVDLVGRRISTVPVLTSPLADKIHRHLPALPRLAKSWSLIYSLDQHGISLKTLYSNCETATAAALRSRSRIHGMLLVVKDSDSTIFGTWMSDGLRMSRGKEGYYGSGESFLWKWLENEGEVRIYKWTGRNNYFALCEPGFISFGGGDGAYGLYLDDTLYEGTSARSMTFDNEVLCSTLGPRLAGGAVGFECVGVEVWSVVS